MDTKVELSNSSEPLKKEDKKEDKKEEKKEEKKDDPGSGKTEKVKEQPLPAKVIEQDLNAFELFHVDRNDPNFKGRWVGIAYKIIKISNVDDQSNTFEADFFLYPTWEEKSLIGGEKGKKFQLSELPLEPKIKFKNEIHFDVVAESYWLQDPAKGTIDSSLRIRGTFFEHLELQNFPFDYQDLRIFCDSFYHKENLRFYQRTDRPNSFAANRFPLPEWGFEDDSFEFRVNKVASGNQYINYIINVPVRRYHEYYVQNSVLVSLMLLFMGVGAFVFDISTIDNRLNFVVTLALTGVAFKYLMTDRLPKVPYSTLFDRYMYAVFFLVTFLGVDLIVIGLVYRDYPDAAQLLNNISAYVYLALTGILHLIVLVFLLFRKKIIRKSENK